MREVKEHKSIRVDSGTHTYTHTHTHKRSLAYEYYRLG